MWQDPSKPITGPGRRETFRQGVIHYEGSGRVTTPLDIEQHLRSLQASYLQHRGYSLGYGFAVVSDINHPNDGAAYEIRGRDLNMASNPGKKQSDGNANNWTASVLIIGPEDRRVSERAAATIRSLFASLHDESGTPYVDALPHSALDYTSCCGIYHEDVAAGLLNPTTQTPTPTPPNESETNMLNSTIIWKKKGTANAFAVVFGVGATHLSDVTYPILVSRLAAAGLPTTVHESVHPQEIKSILAQAGIDEADLEAL